MIGLGRFRFLMLALLVCWLLHSAHLRGQTAPATPPMEMTVPADSNGLVTLHAYSNLIQMPVLVLSPGLQSLAPIKPERFSLSIEGGPRYQPTHVRIEGADPISLTIVLDFVGTASDLMPKIAEAIGQVTSQGLTPRDQVSLFVMQCTLLDVMRDVPADPDLLQAKILKAKEDWDTRSRAKHPARCEETVHLWDTLGLATLRLAQLPGRRVIIAVTDGMDRGSKYSAEEVASAMQKHAVTTFGIRPEAASDKSISARGNGGPLQSLQFSANQVMTNDPFERMSELSGGLALPANRWNAGRQLARIPQLVRGRYILEFPRPYNTTAGDHAIDVQVAKSGDFIRASGTSVPLPDPKILADPTTLPNDPTLTPQIGKTPKKPPPH